MLRHMYLLYFDDISFQFVNLKNENNFQLNIKRYLCNDVVKLNGSSSIVDVFSFFFLGFGIRI